MPRQIKDYQSGENEKENILRNELGLIKNCNVKIIPNVMIQDKIQEI